MLVRMGPTMPRADALVHASAYGPKRTMQWQRSLHYSVGNLTPNPVWVATLPIGSRHMYLVLLGTLLLLSTHSRINWSGNNESDSRKVSAEATALQQRLMGWFMLRGVTTMQAACGRRTPSSRRCTLWTRALKIPHGRNALPCRCLVVMVRW
jgi:hypothetical protein